MPEIKQDKHAEELQRVKLKALDLRDKAFWNGVKLGVLGVLVGVIAFVAVLNHFAGSRLVWALTNEKKVSYAMEADKMVQEKNTREFGEAMVLLNGLDK